MIDARIELLLTAVERAYSKRAWHGTTLRGALRGLEPWLALWRPAADRHNIWELILHVAYWKYIVRRALTGDTSLRFGRKPRDWPAVPEPADRRSLREDIALLQAEHDALLDAIRAFSPKRLDEALGSAGSASGLILGAAAHDTHHAGQIQLLKRLGG